MTAPVDVLAVMDAAIDNLQSGGYIGNTIGMKDSRAAVAELIEVSRVLLTYRVGEYPTRGDLRDNDASRAQLDALATALARVGGAS